MLVNHLIAIIQVNFQSKHFSTFFQKELLNVFLHQVQLTFSQELKHFPNTHFQILKLSALSIANALALILTNYYNHSKKSLASFQESFAYSSLFTYFIPIR